MAFFVCDVLIIEKRRLKNMEMQKPAPKKRTTPAGSASGGKPAPSPPPNLMPPPQTRTPTPPPQLQALQQARTTRHAEDRQARQAREVQQQQQRNLQAFQERVNKPDPSFLQLAEPTTPGADGAGPATLPVQAAVSESQAANSAAVQIYVESPHVAIQMTSLPSTAVATTLAPTRPPNIVAEVEDELGPAMAAPVQTAAVMTAQGQTRPPHVAIDVAALPEQQPTQLPVDVPQITVENPEPGRGAWARVFGGTQQRTAIAIPITGSRTQEPTTLGRLAAVLSRGAQPVATVERSLGRGVEAVASTIIPGYSTTPVWAQEKIRGVRAEACSSGAATSVEPTAALNTLRQPNPISAFWANPAIASTPVFGEHQEEFLGFLDRASQRHGPHLMLALSGACLAATRNEPDLRRQLTPQSFATLGSHVLIAKLTSATLDDDAANDPALGLARAVLGQCAQSNQFNNMVRALCPNGIADAELPILKRFLQADVAVREMQRSGSPANDEQIQAMEEGQLPLAVRVRNNARQQLSQHHSQALERSQVVDNFYWENGFREEGPGTELQKAKQHFHQSVEQLGKAPDALGPLTAVYRHGAAGADRQLLQQNEIAKLQQVIVSPDFDDAVSTVKGALVNVLQAERSRQADGQAPVGNVVRAMAHLIALQDWSPTQKGDLSTMELLHGRAERGENANIQAQLSAMCVRYLSAPEIGEEQPLQTHDDAEQLVGQLTQAQRTVHAVTMERVNAELGNIHLGFRQLEILAEQCAVPHPLFKEAVATIDAESAMPRERTPAAVGEMMAGFLEQVYFGNHVKLSQTVSQGVNTRGFAVNEPAYSAPRGRPTPTPKIVRAELTVEGQTEHVVRAGGATHGGELFLGRDRKHRETAGAGFTGGHEWGTGLVRGRLVAGLDANPIAHAGSSYEGIMFRVERAVREEVMGGDNPRFVQSDADVRRTMAALAQELFTRAPNAQDDASREALLEDLIVRFGHRELSMSLIKQETSANHFEVTASVSGSGSAGIRAIGGRLAAGASMAYEKTWNTQTSEKDSTGSYRINNVRTGFSGRTKAASDATVNMTSRATGAPATALAKGAVIFGEGGANVRVRTTIKDGSIVPEKTFSDTESPDPAVFKDLVLANRQKWVDLFAYEHQHLGGERAQEIGNEKVNEFFAKIEGIREGHHVYYARERMHPDVAQRIDELASAASMLPDDMLHIREELVREQHRLAADDRSWNPASLIAYEKVTKQDGVGSSVLGLGAGRGAAVEGEREIIFDTPGWLQLRKRERENPPTHLDD
jgi:hypothetical protein